ncbi:hypothetical protein SLEP1_g36632 [Rubroshorea leprosula]|uniref:Uncharacterized protein n=1 Tax=Rubroshorea leprosula TaxID=152421 RepID=A0AAV5KS40_9ROSI|nr:hypothetical protein SLEP1_g36632 [Rubroshorea leprosula]
MPSTVTKFLGLYDKTEFLLDLADGAHNFLLNWPRRYPPIKTQDFFMTCYVRPNQKPIIIMIVVPCQDMLGPVM